MCFQTAINYLGRFFGANWPVLVLIALVVLQSHLFIWRLQITPLSDYFIRRTVITTAFGLLFFGPAALLPPRIKYWYLGLMSSLTAVILFAQFIYYSYSSAFLQASALLYWQQGGTTLGTVKILVNTWAVILLLAPILVLLFGLLARFKKIEEKILDKKDKIITGCLIAVFIFLGYGYVMIRERMEAGNVAHLYQYNKLFNVNMFVSKVGILNFSLGDALSFSLRDYEPTAADIDMVRSWLEKQAPAATSTDKYFGLARGRNLILVQVESLENAVIGARVDGREITPRLNELAKEGLYFNNYYAPIGPGSTADVEFTILNSLYPVQNTVAFMQYAYNNYSALPGLLRKNGYHAYAFHGDVPNFWNRSSIYPRLGYERMFGKEDFVASRLIGAYGLGDVDFFSQSVPKLRSLPRPFMATLITLTSHSPFKMPPDLQTFPLASSTQFNELQRQYLQSVHYVDGALGDFVADLKNSGLYDNSLILIYGDHSSFSNISDALNNRPDWPIDLRRIQVPMIILAPGIPLRAVSGIPVSHLDVYPTVADLLGVSLSGAVFGRPMLSGRDTVVVRRDLISGAVNTIVSADLIYRRAGSGIFEEGSCIESSGGRKIDVNVCRALYERESEAVKVSDLMVRGNMIGDISGGPRR